MPGELKEEVMNFRKEIHGKVEELIKVREDTLKPHQWKPAKFTGNCSITKQAVMVPFINTIREPKIDPSSFKEEESSLSKYLVCIPYPMTVRMN